MSRIFGFATSEKELVYVDDVYGFLSVIDTHSKCVEKRVSIYSDEYKAFSNGIKCKEKYVFAPWFGSNTGILIVDGKTRKVEELSLKPNAFGIDHGFFNDVLVISDKVFFIPFQYGSFVELDINSKKLSYHDECIQYMTPDEYDHNNVLLSRFAALHTDGTIYMPCYSMNRVVWYNVTSKKTGYFDVNCECTGFSGVCIDENTLYILSRYKGELYIIDLTCKDTYKKIHLADGDGELFMNLVDCGTYLLAIQRVAEKTLKIEKESYKTCPIDIFNTELLGGRSVLCAKRVGDEVLMITGEEDSNYIGIYKISDEKVVWEQIPHSQSLSVCRDIYMGVIMREGKNGLLSDYIGEVIIEGGIDK